MRGMMMQYLFSGIAIPVQELNYPVQALYSLYGRYCILEGSGMVGVKPLVSVHVFFMNISRAGILNTLPTCRV
jgi:hypothetical protein